MKKSFTFFAISALFLMLLFPVSMKADTEISFALPSSPQPSQWTTQEDDCAGNITSDANVVTEGNFVYSGAYWVDVERKDDAWTGVKSGVKCCTKVPVSFTASTYTITLVTKRKDDNVTMTLPVITIQQGTPSTHYAAKASWDNGSGLQEETISDNQFLYTVEDGKNSRDREVTLTYNNVVINAAGNYRISIDFPSGDKDKYLMKTLTITPNCTQHTVTVAADDDNKGTVAGGGSYCENSEVTVTATPNPGYNFVNWTDNNNSNAEVSTNASYTFTLAANVSYRANFAACAGAAVTVNVNNGDMGAVTGGGSYCAGSQVNLTATPNSGYRFVNWTVTSGSASLDNVKNASTHFTMSNPAAAVTVRANFEEDIKADRTYTYRAVEDNTGHNTNAGESTDEYLFIGADGQYIDFTHYSAEATTCTIKVGFYAPWDGKEFKVLVNDGQEKKDWTWNTTEGEIDMGDFNLSAGYNKITVAASWNWYGIRYIKVIVEESKYVVTVVNEDTHGTVTAASSNFAGEEVNISVDAKPGYFFSGWASDDVTFANALAESTTFEMPANNVTISTTYTTCTQRAVTVVADDDGHGSVSGGGDYCEGASVTVTATPEDGYRFVNWTQGGSQVSTDAVYTFTLSEDISLTANFEVDPCLASLTVQVEDAYLPNGAVSASKGYPTTMIFKEKQAEGAYETGCNGRGFMQVPDEGDKELFIPVNITTAGNYKVKARSGQDKKTYINIYAITGDGETITYNSTPYYKKTYKRINEGHDEDSFAYSNYTDVVSLPIGVCLIGLYSEYSWAAYDEITITCTDGTAFCPTYDITMVNNMGGEAPTADKVKAEENASVSISADATIGEFSFTGWTASSEVTFANASEANTTFTMPAEAVTITANYNMYSRTGAPIAAGNYGTICLPLNGTVTGATLYSVAGKETGDINYLVLEDKGTSLEAGKPYIFQLSADELSVALDGTYTDLQLGNGLVGTYETINPLPYNESGPYKYVLNENVFKKAGNNVTVGAYRAYLNWDEVSAPAQAPGARRIRMVIEGTNSATGLEDLINDQLPVTSKVLIDGQLFIIREGKRYTITGARAQ